MIAKDKNQLKVKNQGLNLQLRYSLLQYLMNQAIQSPAPMTDIEEIRAWVAAHNKTNSHLYCYLSPEGHLDVEGHLILRASGLTSLPFKFGRIYGNFDISLNELTTLENCPTYVEKSFGCSENYLTSLEHGPKEVGGSYYCGQNKLTSLLGAPAILSHSFDCSENQLTSLESAPQKVGKNFIAAKNQLTNLAHFPLVEERIHLANNLLTDLKGLPLVCKSSLHLNNNRLTSLEGLPQSVIHMLDLSDNWLTPQSLTPIYQATYLDLILLKNNFALEPEGLMHTYKFREFKEDYEVWQEKENIKNTKIWLDATITQANPTSKTFSALNESQELSLKKHKI